MLTFYILGLAACALLAMVAEGGGEPVGGGTASLPGQDGGRVTDGSPPAAALSVIEAARTSAGLGSTPGRADEKPGATTEGAERASKGPMDEAAVGKAIEALDPRLKAAGERVGIKGDDLTALLGALGPEKVAAMLTVHADALDKHSAALGADGRKKEQEADAGDELPTLPQEVREAYPDNGDLCDAFEGVVRKVHTATNERLAGVESLILGLAADTTIRNAGAVAEKITRNALLDKAKVLAEGYVMSGETVSPLDVLQEALTGLTTKEAAAAARADLGDKVRDRSKQISGPPAGRAPPPPTTAEAKRAASLDRVEKARRSTGLAPSPR